jgi:hypothetical protein
VSVPNAPSGGAAENMRAGVVDAAAAVWKFET